MPLRPYQEHDLDCIREAYRQGFQRPLLVQPTGAGKGFLIAYIVREASARGFRIQFWVNRRTLVHDMSHRLEAIGVDHGVIMAQSKRKKPWLPVQVVSIDTLRNRAAPPPADLVVIDECLTGDTMVLTDEGEVPISDKSLVGKRAISYDKKNLKWVTASIVGWIQRPIKKILSVSIGGRLLRCTNNHLFLTTRGWIPAASLLTSDYVYTPRSSQSLSLSVDLYTARFSATPQSDTPTTNADSLDYTVTMAVSSRHGQSTKLQDFRPYKYEHQQQQMADGERLTSDLGHATIPASSQSCKPSNTVASKSSAQVGWIPSRMREWLGGTWMMGAFRLVRVVRQLFTFTPKASPATRVPSFATGSTPNILTRTFPTTDESTHSSHSTRNPPDAGCVITKSIQSHQWITSLEKVESVSVAGEEKVFDIEVEVTHNFVANGVVVHNCHFAVSDGWRQMIALYPDAKFLLTTATPIRLDNRGMGEIADVMITGPSVQDLIGQGFLVPSEVYSFQPPDLSAVTKTAGDYNQKQLATATDKAVLVGDAVKTWLRLASDRKSVSFCVDKKHAAHVAEEYRKAGVDAIEVTDETSDDERDKIWKDFDTGTLRMVTSVGVISYGWDHPICSCVCLLRPTQSLQLHLQQIGRGCRPAPGKTHLLVLDHAGNHSWHSFYETPREWSLDSGLVKKPTDKVTPVATCKVCYYTFPSGPSICAACGAVIPKQHRNIQTIEGELQRLERKQEAIEDWRARITEEQKRARYLQLRREAREKSYKATYAAARYRAEFKSWPSWEWNNIAI